MLKKAVIGFIFFLMHVCVFAQMTESEIKQAMSPLKEAFHLIADKNSSLIRQETESGTDFFTSDQSLRGTLYPVYDKESNIVSLTYVLIFNEYTVDGVSITGKNIIMLSYIAQDMTGVIGGRLRIGGAETNRLNWDNTRIMTHPGTLLPYEGVIYMEGGSYNVDRNWFK